MLPSSECAPTDGCLWAGDFGIPVANIPAGLCFQTQAWWILRATECVDWRSIAGRHAPSCAGAGLTGMEPVFIPVNTRRSATCGEAVVEIWPFFPVRPWGRKPGTERR